MGDSCKLSVEASWVQFADARRQMQIARKKHLRAFAFVQRKVGESFDRVEGLNEQFHRSPAGGLLVDSENESHRANGVAVEFSREITSLQSLLENARSERAIMQQLHEFLSAFTRTQEELLKAQIVLDRTAADIEATKSMLQILDRKIADHEVALINGVIS